MVDLSQTVWRKSSRSGDQGDCVEVADNLPGIVAVRDSKNPDGGTLILSMEAFRDLVSFAKER